VLLAAIASAQQAGRLRGTVVDENGKPIPGVQVSVIVSQKSAGEAYTDSKGMFAVENVPVGACTLKLQLAGMPDQERAVDVVSGRVTTTTVELNLSRLLAVLETVTVTARKEEEQMQATPVPVSAITASTLAADRLDTVDRVVELVPNAVIDSAPSQYGTQVNIRGVEAKPITLAENGVGFYRNGQYDGGTIPAITALIDVDQVEVMRGPQGGLFGRNAVGGAMNIIYGTPRHATEAAVNFRYGSYERADVDAVVNVPLSDQFDLRVVGWRYGQEKGPHFNVTLNEQMDKSHDEGGRLGLRYLPRSDMSFVWVYERVDTSGPSYETFFEQPRPHPLAAYGYPPRPAETEGSIYRNTPSRSDSTFDFFSNEFVWSSPHSGELTIDANYRRYANTAIYDFDFTADSPTDFPGALEQVGNQSTAANSGTVEARYATAETHHLKGLTGISFYRESLNYAQAIDTSLNLTFLSPALGIGTGTGELPATITTDSWSWFGELKATPTKNVEISASLRYNNDSKSAHMQQYLVTDNPIMQMIFASELPTIDLTADRTFTNWSPGIDLAYRASETVTLYGRVDTGFRAGGFNAAASSADLLPFGPETSVNFEAGLKSEWFQHRLRANVSVFRFDQSNLLLTQPDPTVATFAELQNAGSARTNGFELELEAQPTAGLNLGAALGLLDAKITSGHISQGFGEPTLDISGQRISGTAKATGALHAQWSHALAANTAVQLGANYRLKSDVQGYYGEVGAPVIAGYGLLDLSTGLTFGTWQASVFGENVTNDQGIIYWNQVGSAYAVDRRLGRVWGVKVGYKFR
jgi:iron complex outermembrane receptor protein